MDGDRGGYRPRPRGGGPSGPWRGGGNRHPPPPNQHYSNRGQGNYQGPPPVHVTVNYGDGDTHGHQGGEQGHFSANAQNNQAHNNFGFSPFEFINAFNNFQNQVQACAQAMNTVFNMARGQNMNMQQNMSGAGSQNSDNNHGHQGNRPPQEGGRFPDRRFQGQGQDNRSNYDRHQGGRRPDGGHAPDRRDQGRQNNPPLPLTLDRLLLMRSPAPLRVPGSQRAVMTVSVSSARIITETVNTRRE